CAAGYFEAITLSFVTDEQCELFMPRGELPKLKVEHSSRKQENVLRQSLVPSLLASLRENERQGTFDAKLFEIARVYLKAAPGEPEQQTEPTMIGLAGGRSFRDVKGVIEALVQHVAPGTVLAVRPSPVPQFTAGRGAELWLDGQLWGWLGELDRPVTERLKLHETVIAAELDLAILERSANLTPAFTPLPEHPAIERDLNFVLDEAVMWQELETTVRDAGGGLLESVDFVDQYRGERIGPEKKSYVLRAVFRAADRTLTGEEVDAAQQAIVGACATQLRAALR
ncbi:MAG: phenylalanine--tRNA ligase subunit beta, partial [Planctomycetaceae bacterium]